MKEQVLRIMELCIQLKEEKGYDIFFRWEPHCDMVSIRHSEKLNWDEDGDIHFYHQTIYFYEPMHSEVQIQNCIKHLESLL